MGQSTLISEVDHSLLYSRQCGTASIQCMRTIYSTSGEFHPVNCKILKVLVSVINEVLNFLTFLLYSLSWWWNQITSNFADFFGDIGQHVASQLLLRFAHASCHLFLEFRIVFTPFFSRINIGRRPVRIAIHKWPFINVNPSLKKIHNLHVFRLKSLNADAVKIHSFVGSCSNERKYLDSWLTRR